MREEERPTGVGCFVAAGVLAVIAAGCLISGVAGLREGGALVEEVSMEANARTAHGGETLSDGTHAQPGDLVTTGNSYVINDGLTSVFFGAVALVLAVLSLVTGIQDRRAVRAARAPGKARDAPR